MNQFDIVKKSHRAGFCPIKNFVLSQQILPLCPLCVIAIGLITIKIPKIAKNNGSGFILRIQNQTQGLDWKDSLLKLLKCGNNQTSR